MAAALIEATPPPRPIRLARLCLERLHLRPPIDLEAVARASRVFILEQPPVPGAPECDAFLAHATRSGIWAIFLNHAVTDWRRRRMSVAHELGHFILHRSLIRAGQTSADLSEDRLEAEAYQFAGELLMPEWWVRMVYRHHPAPHESCQVSRTAWRRRLVDLGLGTAEPEPIASVTVAPIRGVARATLVPSP